MVREPLPAGAFEDDAVDAARPQQVRQEQPRRTAPRMTTSAQFRASSTPTMLRELRGADDHGND